MKKILKYKNEFIIAFFILMLGLLLSSIWALIPKGLNVLLIILLIILCGVFYDKYVVKILGLEMTWWSPHVKRLELTNGMVGKIDPEADMMFYFLARKFRRYSLIRTKKGFGIIAKKEGIEINVKLKENHLKIIFIPSMSKKTISEMEKMMKYFIALGLKEFEKKKK